jgi:hypothetical protein
MAAGAELIEELLTATLGNPLVGGRRTVRRPGSAIQ